MGMATYTTFQFLCLRYWVFREGGSATNPAE
jgi:hypothetical protein